MIESLRKYKVSDFKVTKNDIVHESRQELPEGKTLAAIADWAEYACQATGIDQSESDKWDLYPVVYFSKVVYRSNYWPLFLPVGYVFTSFVLSTDIQIVKLDHHLDAFNAWMESGVNRERLFESYDKKRLWIDPQPVSNDYFNGKIAGDALYSPSKTTENDQLNLL